MKVFKYVAATAGAAALLTGITAHAANQIVFAGSGSSALFNQFAQGAHTSSGASNNWSGSGKAFVADPNAPSEKGNIWVVWDNGAPNNRRIWLDVSVDSTVGNRAFFNNDTLVLDSSVNTSLAGANLVSGQPTDSTLPADVIASINGVTFDAGLTDIRPEDALVATARAFNLGYSNTSGNGIKDSLGGQAYPVRFSLGSRSYATTSIGAVPVLVFVNSGSGSALTNVTNINRFTLGKILDGTFTRTSDLDATATLTSQNLTAFIREPLSGTYNTMEFCIPSSLEVKSSQESGVSSNPLNDAGITFSSGSVTNGASSTGGRVRVIGTGALVKAVNTAVNSIGYGFWSTSTFANASNTRYLTVEGADPLLPSYTGGVYPGAGNVTFSNIQNGGYPIWSVVRIVADPNDNNAADVTALVNNVLGIAAGADFVRASDLKVFRSHRKTSLSAAQNGGTAVSIPANNGVVSANETGSDVGGAVFVKNNDLGYNTDTGGQLTGFRQ